MAHNFTTVLDCNIRSIFYTFRTFVIFRKVTCVASQLPLKFWSLGDFFFQIFSLFSLLVLTKQGYFGLEFCLLRRSSENWRSSGMSMAQIAEHFGALAISPWKANDFPWVVVVGFPLCAGKSTRCLRMCYLFWRSYSKLNKNDTSYPQTTKMRSSNDLSCSWPMLPIKQLTNGGPITVIETAVWVSLLTLELFIWNRLKKKV